MKFEIENTAKENLTIINAIINYLARYEVQTLKNVNHMLYSLFTNEIFKENYIWGQGGSHIWLSQKNDGKRIMIFR
jgi:hypothetical protein